MNFDKLRAIVEEKAKANNIKFKATALDEIVNIAGRIVWHHYPWRTRYCTAEVSVSSGDYRVQLPDDFHNWESGHIYSSSNNIGCEFNIVDSNKYNELFRNQQGQGSGIPLYGKFTYDNKLYIYFNRPADTSYTLVINYHSAYTDITKLPSSCDMALITASAYAIAGEGSEEAARIGNQLFGIDLPNAIEGDQIDQSSPTNMRREDFSGNMPFHMDR